MKSPFYWPEIDEARAMGLTYGKYRALLYEQERKQPSKTQEPEKPKKKSLRRFTDSDAFALWQQGFSDSQIGAALGVPRQSIQRWRSNLELPSTASGNINTKRYRLEDTPYGIFAIFE